MNNVKSMMDKIVDLRQQRAILLGLCIILGCVVLIPSDVKELRKENALLKRYALRIEKQNAMKDEALIKLVTKFRSEGAQR